MPQAPIEKGTDDQGRDQKGEDVPKRYFEVSPSVKLSPGLPGHIQPLSRYGEALAQNLCQFYFEDERHEHR